jgi:hypothetical protein
MDRERVNDMLDQLIFQWGETSADTERWEEWLHDSYLQGWREHGNAHDCYLDPNESCAHRLQEEARIRRAETNRRLDAIIERLHKGWP